MVLLATTCKRLEGPKNTTDADGDAFVSQHDVEASDVHDDTERLTPRPSVRVYVELSPVEAGRRIARLVAPEMRFSVDLGTIASNERCVVHASEPDPRYSGPPVHTLDIGCGLRFLASVSHEARRGLSIFVWQETLLGPARSLLERAQPVPPGVDVVLDPSFHDPLDAPCSADGGTTDVQVFAAPTYGREGRALSLTAPTVGLRLEAPMYPNGYCDGRRWPTAGRLVISCTHVDAWYEVAVQVTGSSLLVREATHDHDGSNTRDLGGVALPCGARVRFPYVHIVDPGWAPLGNCRCAPAYDECVRPCEEKFSDETASLTARGLECAKPCEAARNACEAQCSR